MRDVNCSCDEPISYCFFFFLHMSLLMHWHAIIHPASFVLIRGGAVQCSLVCFECRSWEVGSSRSSMHCGWGQSPKVLNFYWGQRQFLAWTYRCLVSTLTNYPCIFGINTNFKILQSFRSRQKLMLILLVWTGIVPVIAFPFPFQ